MKPGALLIRTDASRVIGTGHVMRCLALAQSWQDAGGQVVFAMAESTSSIEARLRDEEFPFVRIASPTGSAADAAETGNLAKRQNASWVVVDGYGFGADYQADLKGAGLKLLFIDDNGLCEHYAADIVLNQNAHARESLYSRRDASTQLLFGPRFAMLRREFTAWREWNREIPPAGRRILVTMGGSDPQNLTPRILTALSGLAISGLEIRVVVGGSAENQSVAEQAARQFPGSVEVLTSVSNMAELMAWADLAVAGAGTTCWEMCLLGLPAILLVVAENQRLIASHLAKLGAAVDAGLAEHIDRSFIAKLTAELLVDRERRLQMSRAARQLVDGKGNERVLAAMQTREVPCA